MLYVRESDLSQWGQLFDPGILAIFAVDWIRLNGEEDFKVPSHIAQVAVFTKT